MSIGRREGKIQYALDRAKMMLRQEPNKRLIFITTSENERRFIAQKLLEQDIDAEVRVVDRK